jgi:cytochrome c oxidase cbb3-type subunit I
MSETLTQGQTTAVPAVSESDIEKVERVLIDQSVQVPVLFFYTSAILWLLAATILGLISSIKLHAPTFLDCAAWLTYGRVWPAFISALTYGWASLAGMGTAIWLCARLTRVALRSPMILVVGAVFWNLGVTTGIIGVLAGNNKAVELLEFPGFSQVLLFIGFTLIAVWGAVMFYNRRPGHAFISLWYIVGAFFWFAWLYSAANLMITVFHVHGVVQAAVGAWYAGGFFTLWLTSLGLGAIYYFIPKISGKPIHSYHLASLGFWSFALLAGWTGMSRLVGGPLPAWLITAGIVASILMLIPVATVTLNFVLTMKGNYGLVYSSPVIRFVFFGAISYALASVLGIVGSLRSVASITQFTQFPIGQTHIVVYAFFSMVMFGSIYYVVPRLVGCEWLSSRLISLHFLGAVYGIGLIVFCLLVGGLFQGGAWDDNTSTTIRAVESVLPFIRLRTFGWVLLLFSHFFFAIHFLAMLLRLGRPSGRPTLFVSNHGEVTH